MCAEDTRISSEDALVAQIAALIERTQSNGRVINGIGDDTALWQPSRSHRSCITSDTLVEGVHLRRDLMSLHDAGYRAMTANLSDCAAAGARPVLATVALGLPAETPAQDTLALYGGIADCAAAFGCALAGGDLTRSPALTIAITLVGEVRPSNVKGRAGARPGDIIALTGPLGAARAGLALASGTDARDAQGASAALESFRRPQPRLAQGRWLAASAHVHAMMDLSDGLSSDLARMCVRSGCGALLETVPVAASAAGYASQHGEDPVRFALAGGEDFELLVALAPRAFRHLSARYRKRFGVPLLSAGHFCEGSGIKLRNGDREEPVMPTGYDHFAPGPGAGL